MMITKVKVIKAHHSDVLIQFHPFELEKELVHLSDEL